ncbi:hypothetical protein AB0C51_14715 [Streptomyces pathocidini]|uniref:Uncharacterized protein n=1 Tax=Streptomyces pathocidini TaxID=1650571 RepID=A0ABW7UR54_9ACTN
MSTHNPPPPPHHDHSHPYGRGGNPLRRPSDRAQRWLTGLLLVVLAGGVPAAAMSAGFAVHDSTLRTVQTQVAQRHQVTARLTQDPANAASQGSGDDLRSAQVRWTEKDGAVRTGQARVSAGSSKGDTVRIWVDRQGRVTDAPMSSQAATANGWLAGGLAAGAVATFGLAAHAGLRIALDRRRYAQWEAEWEQVEPQWARRFGG